MSDWIDINDLAIEMSIGAYTWETQVRQKVLVNIRMYCDTKVAGLSDELSDSVDYAEVAGTIKDLAQKRHYTLIESFAEASADALLNTARVNSVVITVTKPGAIPDAQAVSVTINRSH